MDLPTTCAFDGPRSCEFGAEIKGQMSTSSLYIHDYSHMSCLNIPTNIDK